MPKAEVTNPSDKAIKRDSTFQWKFDGIYYFSSKVIVGSLPGSDNNYVGREFSAPTTTDTGVSHPRDGKKYYTRVRYRKYQGGPWCTDYSVIREFTSS